MNNAAKLALGVVLGIPALNMLVSPASDMGSVESYSFDSETEQFEVVEVPHIGSATRESPDQNQIKLEWDGTTGAIASFHYTISSTSPDGSMATHTENFNVVIPGEVTFYLDQDKSISALAGLQQRGSLSLRISKNGKLCEKHKATGDMPGGAVACYEFLD